MSMIQPLGDGARLLLKKGIELAESGLHGLGDVKDGGQEHEHEHEHEHADGRRWRDLSNPGNWPSMR